MTLFLWNCQYFEMFSLDWNSTVLVQYNSLFWEKYLHNSKLKYSLEMLVKFEKFWFKIMFSY